MSQEKRAEFSGRSVDDAVSRASKELGIPVAQVQYRIVDDTTKSILGLVISGIVTIDALVPDGVEVASRDAVPVVDKPKKAPKPAAKPAPKPAPKAQPKAENRPLSARPQTIVSSTWHISFREFFLVYARHVPNMRLIMTFLVIFNVDYVIFCRCGCHET